MARPSFAAARPTGRGRRPSLRARAAAVVLVGALAVLVGCSSNIGGTAAIDADARTTAPTAITQPSTTSAVPTTEESTTAESTTAESNTEESTRSPLAVPAGLERFYQQELTWGSCAEYAPRPEAEELFAKPEFECTDLVVPLSYEDTLAASDPNGPTITLAVLRKPATDQANRIGSAIFNPGGPGASGNESAAGNAEAAVNLNQRFDLVGFDPRGVGASRPAVQCQTGEERDATRAFTPRSRTQAEVDEANAVQAEIAQLCLERTGVAEGIDSKAFLANVGTRDVARDLDVLRGALGDEQLTYVGFSYGTSIGVEYAEQFPANVRAMVLDGVAGPEEDAATSGIRQAEGFQQAFEDFAAWCAERPNCALGADPAQSVAVYHSLVRPLLDEPLTLEDGRTLTHPDAITGTIQALYSDQLWEILAGALLQLSTGDGQVLMALADFYLQRSENGQYGSIIEVFNAVRCVDRPAVTDPAAVTRYNADYAAAAPFADPGDPAGAILDICAVWPLPPTSEPNVPDIPGLPRLLVVSTEGDPATPYQAGVDLAAAIDAALLTVEGTRHTAYLSVGDCVDGIVDAYLIDLTLPADGARC